MTSTKQFGFWQTLYLAFYSKKLYRDVAQRWRGTGVLHLFFLFLLSATINLASSIYLPNDTLHVTQTIVTTAVSSQAMDNDKSHELKPVEVSRTETIDTQVPSYNQISAVATLFFLVPAYFLVLTIGLIVSAIGKAFTKNLSFKAIYRLSMVSTTPSLILGLLISPKLLQQIIAAAPLLLPLFMLLPFFYFIYGIRANLASTEQPIA